MNQRKSRVGGPRLKNYSAKRDLEVILQAIHRTLTVHKARRVAFDYNEAGYPTTVTFQLAEEGGVFRLPARLENVKPLVLQALSGSHHRRLHGEELEEQAAITGWSNILAWLEAQMALLQTKMVDLEEIFLPYLLVEGYDGPITYYEAHRQQRALPEQRGGIMILEQRGGHHADAT